MTEQHPITPPPELIEKWHSNSPMDRSVTVAIQAARWGADKELDACLDWFREFYQTTDWVKHDLKIFRAARRPKPKSLAAEALEALAYIEDDVATCLDSSIVRRALERLQELEGQGDG